MSNNQVYAGIDIGGTMIKYGLVDSDGKVLFRDQRPSVVKKGATALMHLVANVGETLLYQAAEDDLEVRWLGVGTPGTVELKSGKVIGSAPNIKGWEGMEIGQSLRDRLNTRVYVDNDANVMALAEAKFGAAVGYESVVCVTVGTGVGGAVMFGGRLWRGSSHAAGEIGHISIDPNGPKCRCGSVGCLEMFCCSSAILERTRARLEANMTPDFEDLLDKSIKNLSIKKLFAALKKGDEVAKEIIEETAEYLGHGLAGVVNLLNPNIVVIGGGVADGGSGFVEAVATVVRRRAIPAATANLRIAGASLGNDAGFIGAGLLGEMTNAT